MLLFIYLCYFTPHKRQKIELELDIGVALPLLLAPAIINRDQEKRDQDSIKR